MERVLGGSIRWTDSKEFDGVTWIVEITLGGKIGYGRPSFLKTEIFNSTEVEMLEQPDGLEEFKTKVRADFLREIAVQFGVAL